MSEIGKGAEDPHAKTAEALVDRLGTDRLGTDRLGTDEKFLLGDRLGTDEKFLLDSQPFLSHWDRLGDRLGTGIDWGQDRLGSIGDRLGTDEKFLLDSQPFLSHWAAAHPILTTNDSTIDHLDNFSSVPSRFAVVFQSFPSRFPLVFGLILSYSLSLLDGVSFGPKKIPLKSIQGNV
jgi:hypothetical protein